MTSGDSRKHDDASDGDYPQEEAEKRRDDLLGKLLRTPPKPRPPRDRMPEHEYVVMDGKMLVAVVTKRGEGEMTADLYRNLDDLRDGAPVERSVELAVN